MRILLRSVFSLLMGIGMLAVVGGGAAVAQADLTLQSSRTEAEIRSDGTATTTVTVTLDNAGSSDASSVAVDVSVPSGLTVTGSSASAGSYGSGTWDGVDVAASSSETLELTVTLSASQPQDLTAALTGDASTSTRARIVPVPYGSETALTLDGIDDYVELSRESRFDLKGDFSVTFWMRVDGGSFDDVFEGLVTKGNSTWRVHRAGDGSSVRFDVSHSGGVSFVEGSSSVEDGEWHHVAAVYDRTGGALRLYIDGQLERTTSEDRAVKTDDQPVFIGDNAESSGREFGGQIDQVRIWNKPLTQEDVQAWAHRTINLDDASGTGALIAAYRLDAGTGSEAFDVGAGTAPYADGTLRGAPKWTQSEASVGRASTVLTDGNTPVTVGPTGSQVDGRLVSGTSTANSATVYRWGRADGALITDDNLPTGITERSNVAWGLWAHGTAETDATIHYDAVSGLVTDGSEPVQLLRRRTADADWTVITENVNVNHNTTDNQFSVTGVTGRYQYSVTNAAPVVDLTLRSGRTGVEVQDEADATLTFTLENTDASDDATGVAVDVSVPAGLSLANATPSAGSYSDGTWDVGTVAASSSETLDLTVTREVNVPQDVAAHVSAIDQTNPGENAARVRVAPAPYGSGRALSFDGSGDYVSTGAPGDSLGLVSESFSIDGWFRLRSTGDDRSLVGMDGGGQNEQLHLVFENQQIRFAFYFNDLRTTSSPIETGRWYHVAAVYDATKADGKTDRYIYLNGVQVAADESPSDFKGTGELLIGRRSGKYYFDGTIDQVRIWQDALTAEEVRRRMTRTIELDGGTASELVAAYRFDTGSGATVYDVGAANRAYDDGTVQGDPQWTAVSGARLGRESTALTDGESATLGPTGGTVSVSGVSTTSGDADSDTLQVYQYGRTDGPTVTSSDAGEDFSQISDDVTRRLHTVWGFEEIGGVSADVTIDYSGVQGLSTPENVRLLKRNGPGQPWQNVSSNWSWNESAQTFSISGLSSFSQYAIGEASTALPVELASFEGATSEEGVRLSWTTASETGNARFDIQRQTAGTSSNAGNPEGEAGRRSSTAGEDWQTVGQVKGAGTTAEPQDYRFTDTDLPYAADTLTYRLKQVDVDGTVHYSDEITVDRGGVETLQLKAPYPHPVQRRATVPFAVPDGTEAEAVTVRLYDVLGRQVRTLRAEAEPGRHELTLDVRGLGSGTYFLRLRGADAAITQKVTVVR